MFAVIFTIFAFTAAHAAEMPSYINVCGRKNPNLNQCIVDNIVNLEDKVCGGLADLNVPKLEPLDISQLVLAEAVANKIILNNVQITGFCNYKVDSVSADLDKLMFNVSFIFERFYLNGTYDFDARIVVPISYKSPIYITADNVKVKAILQASMANVKGKKHMYVSEMKTIINIKAYEAKYDVKREELTQVAQIIASIIDDNQPEFIKRLTPPLEVEIAKWLVTIFNSLFKMFSYDELFPDRT